MPKKKPSGRTLTGSRVDAQRRLKRARIDAMTTPRYKKKPTVPLTPAETHSQGAAKRREGWMEGTAIGRLFEALTGKKKK